MPSALPSCLAERGSVCLLDVCVSPNARRTHADGLHDGALRVRLAAQPVDGKANQALVDWLAAELGCSKRAVELLRGQTSRRKQLRIEWPVADVAAWLGRLLT